jgi:hypothetical protein
MVASSRTSADGQRKPVSHIVTRKIEARMRRRPMRINVPAFKAPHDPASAGRGAHDPDAAPGRDRLGLAY